MDIQIECSPDTNPLHGQVSRETQLIECVKAFGANLLRDIDERKLELKNLLDSLDTLGDPGDQSTRGAPPTPTAVVSALSSEPAGFSWQGGGEPGLRTSPASGSSDGTKHPYPSISLGMPRVPNRLRVAIPATNIGTPIGMGQTTPQSRAVAQRHATPALPADTITLVNPFTGQRWPLTPPPRQPHELDRPQNQVEGNKSPRENPNTAPPRKSAELSSRSKISPRVIDLVANATQEVIKEIYLLALLRLPPMYFVRVGRVIHDAELSEEDVEEISVRSDDAWEAKTNDGRRTKLATFKSSWESFADSLIKEWKTFNVVSVLLLSSVVAILQLQTDPSSACRISALLSLLFGLMSLLYGCLYIVRFGTMKKMYSAIRYVKDAERTNNSVFWNAWVLIAMPAVWLSWSIIFFFVCILSYVWQDQTSNANGCRTTISTPSLPAQIVVSLVFSVGLIYFVMVVRVFSHYARDGKTHSDGDIRTSRPTQTSLLSPYGLPGPPTRPPGLQQPLEPFDTFKPLQNMNNIDQCMEVPIQLRDRDTLPDDWRHYISSLVSISKDRLPENTIEIVDVWNDSFFIPRGVQAIFCMEGLDNLESDPGPNTNLTTPILPTLARDRLYRLGRYVLYITHLPNGRPWMNLTLTLRAQTPDWLGGYRLEEDVKYIKPLGGAATDTHARRWAGQQ